MASGSFGGIGTSVIGQTAQWVHVGGIPLPSGRNSMINGTSPAIITGMGAYASGRGASRSIQLGFEGVGYTNNFSVGASSQANDTGIQGCGFFTNGGSGTFRISGSGSFYFGRGGSGGPSTDSYGYSFSNVLYGYYNYVCAPSAPTSPAVSAPTTTSAALTWGAPSDSGDTGITGYRVDYSTSSTFASNVTSVEVGNVNSYTVAGLAASTAYYFRVFAENYVTQTANSWSQPSSTVTLTTSTTVAPSSTIPAMSSTVVGTFTYPTGSVGFWNFWMTLPFSSTWYMSVAIAGTFGGTSLNFGVDPSVGFWAATSTATNPMTDGPAFRPSGGFLAGSHYFSVGVAAVYSGTTWTFPLTLYVDGVQVATATSKNYTPPTTFPNSARQPTVVQIGTIGTAGTAVISRLSHTLNQPREDLISVPTEASFLSALSVANPQISLAPLPANLSTAPVGFSGASGISTLDGLNLIVRTEQAYIDTVTNGVITNPTQAVRIRGRDRPATVSYTFDAQLELSGIPNFVRDITNLIWSDNISGAYSATQVVSQAALQTRAGSNNASDTVATYRPTDLYEWGTDRLWRGQNVALRPISVTIDNVTCPTDRSADLLTMMPGDRIRITNIPTGPLGFTTWDGWLIDMDETHTSGPAATDTFTLYLQPCQPTTAIYDTDLYANGGTVTLNAAITATATSMTVVSADNVTWLSTVTPYVLQIDSEQVTVSSVAAPSGGTQTATIARGANSTTAAAHAAGAIPEVTSNSIFAF